MIQKFKGGGKLTRNEQHIQRLKKFPIFSKVWSDTDTASLFFQVKQLCKKNFPIEVMNTPY